MFNETSSTGTHQAWMNDLDPHKYTAGRWLRNEGKELQLRQVDFDFDALCRKVLGLSGACYIADCENIEGRSNRVFKFTFSDSRPVLAKLPSKLASPAYLTTASEVATIKYIQKCTSVPVPRVLEWSADTMYDIHSEYIIIEHANGAPAGEKWPSMTLLQRMRFIENLYRQLKAEHRLRFPAYGSI